MPEGHDEFWAWTERRAYWRNAVVWSGNLTVEDSSVECVVLNVSANGAKLRFSKPFDINDPSGVLNIPRLGGFKAEVAWVKGNTVGVRFDEPPERVAALVAAVLPQARHAS